MIYRVLLTLIATIFTLQTNAQIGKVLDEIAAIVGDKIILKSFIEEQRIQLLNQRYYSNKDLRCEILEDQLYTKLLTNQAELDSVEVSDKDVETELDRRLAYFMEELGENRKLKYFNKTILELKEELRGTIRDQMISQECNIQSHRILP